MKNCLIALSAMLVLTSCAGVNVKRTQVASGATNPDGIYIRPFTVSSALVQGRHGSVNERPLRQSLFPAQFAQALKQEMSKLGPAVILEDDETPPIPTVTANERNPKLWLVEGEFDLVHAGSPALRGILPHTGAGRSTIRIHVRITDVSRQGLAFAEGKNVSGEVDFSRSGQVLYEFDIAGGSSISDAAGSIYAPGLGYATPFDFRNAAERVMMALSPDPHRYGVRSSPTLRY